MTNLYSHNENSKLSSFIYFKIIRNNKTTIQQSITKYDNGSYNVGPLQVFLATKILFFCKHWQGVVGIGMEFRCKQAYCLMSSH